MTQLASTIQAQFEQLTRQYEQRLAEIDMYAQMSVPERLNVAHLAFNFVIESLRDRNDEGLVQFVQTRVDVHLGRTGQLGYLAIESFLAALIELENIVLPLVDAVEDAIAKIEAGRAASKGKTHADQREPA